MLDMREVVQDLRSLAARITDSLEGEPELVLDWAKEDPQEDTSGYYPVTAYLSDADLEAVVSFAELIKRSADQLEKIDAGLRADYIRRFGRLR